MKALTIWQPWASLIIDDKKHIETRSWATSYRGLLGIHAAQRCPLDGLLRDMSAKTRAMAFNELGFEGDTVNWKKEFPTGLILGYANLYDCLKITKEFSEWLYENNPCEYAFGDYTPGRYAWYMDDLVKFQEPVPAKGMQRLWNYDIPIIERSM